ncbi:hypothetical protein V5P93_003119 [Actinokineospora auranticolor]|uniref:Uncharacterized protein n=1 Tax=Actinokineospora auranticolor TaxID=155976 RepID=A0A2S6H1B9_9PSEU|nr:hypothetical protein [Actinokineospora auranticolor]PPK71254.1 hypothetical protein CLV40_101443 [Actinokineospora auranticolor]
MHPPPGAKGSLIHPDDAFDVPVFVRWSDPLNPAGRPPTWQVTQARKAWPPEQEIPEKGAYRVPTTWREVVKAAISVGREPTGWMAAVPALAQAELIARRSPLMAYLTRAEVGRGHPTTTGYAVQPNVVYTHGTEVSAKAAFGYRIGMTMAEWACRGLMGLGRTLHAEAFTSPDLGSGWSTGPGLPDLVGRHHDTEELWLVEAKGSKRLGRSMLAEGAKQLTRPDLVSARHMKVLCGTSLTDQLFMTIDAQRSAGQDPRPPAGDTLALVRENMLVYLALRALSPRDLRALPVGSGVGGSSLTLLEADESTASERADLGRGGSRGGGPSRWMLTGPVPGTDLVVGLSRGLFAACEAFATAQREIAEMIEDDYWDSLDAPEGDPWTRGMVADYRDSPDPAVLPTDRVKEHEQLYPFYWRQERERLEPFLAGVAASFETGSERSWATLLAHPVRFRSRPGPGVLEAATEHTYLALVPNSISA